MTHLQTSDEDFSNDDSDAELQAAYSRGDIKPGLNYEAQGKKEYTNEVEGLTDKLADFRRDLAWLERLDVTCGPAKLPGEPEESKAEKDDADEVHDDFRRELRIYKQAQAAVLEALPKLHSLNIPTKRPEDFFAEMAKSDDHMRKVREKLISKQLSMEKSEKAKKLRELRKFGKKVQQEVLLKRQKEKKELAESVKKFKRGHNKDLGFLEGKSQGGPAGPGKQNGGPNQKRQVKNTKFGYGGKKKGGKLNTRRSAQEEDDHFSMRRNKVDVVKHRKQLGGKKQKGGKQKRPGKGKRQKLKSRRK